MNYGETQKVEKYEAGKVVLSIESYKEREVVKDDAEELAKFLEFQREHKGDTHISFARATNNKGTRFIDMEWRK